MNQKDNSQTVMLDFVKEAMHSLATCATRLDAQMLRRWFPEAFNYWYCPAVRRGYRGAMGPVFDLGILLCEPMVDLRSIPREDENRLAYVELLARIDHSPWMAVARKLWTDAPKESRPEVERILVGSMIHVFSGVWDKQHAGPAGGLPLLKPLDEGRMVEVWDGADRVPLGRIPCSLAAERPAIPYPRPREEKEAQTPATLDLLAAHVTTHTPHGDELLDRQVVEACLFGPNLRARRYDPPPLNRTETIKHTRSALPGTNAGVTRAEVKLPEDPPISILPSELALVKAWESRERQSEPTRLSAEQQRARALFPLADILLNRKPLVYKRENPRDLVPRHRALVCFVTGAGAEGSPEPVGPGVRPYTHSYIWAKRQTFDLIRDLREAFEQVRFQAFVDIDIAIFTMRQNEGQTIVHSKFALKEMPLREKEEKKEDRLRQMMDFDDLVPGFFNLLPETGGLGRNQQGRLTPGLSIHPHVGAFLRHEAQGTKPYHAMHLVLAGSELDHWTFIRVVGRDAGREMRARQSLTLIGIDLSGPNPSDQALVPGDPTWLHSRSRTTSEACALLGRGQLPKVSLETLRRRFVESVMGRARQRDNSLLQQLRLA